MREDFQFLTEKEFAERFRISQRTLQRWREDGGGPDFVRLGERRLAYPLDAALRWAAERTFSHRAAEAARTAA